jgi:hypothetical protein
LRGTVRGELGLACGVLLSAALLSTLPPGGQPRPGPAAPPAPLQATGADYTTSVRVTLSVTPGTAGPNRFTADLADYDSHRPVPADRVWLSCSTPDRPGLGVLELDLTQAGDGRWTATGSALPLAGSWEVSASVQSAAGTFTVPLRVQVGRGRPGHLADGVAADRKPGDVGP